MFQDYLPNLQKLKEQLYDLDNAGVRYCLRESLIRKSLIKTVNDPWPIRRAKAFSYILDNTEPLIFDNEVILGSIMGLFPLQKKQSEYDQLYAESKAFIFKQIKLVNNKYRDHALTQHDFDYFSARIDYETLKSISKKIHRELKSKNYDSIGFENIFSELQNYYMGEKQVWEKFVDTLETEGALLNQDGKDPVWTFAHHIAVNYEKVLKLGFGGLLVETQKYFTASLSKETKDFYKAVIISLKGVVRFIRKYAAAARKKAETETNKNRCMELNKVSEIISSIAVNPASNFHEAIQLFWFTHIILCLAGGIALASGRFDQYMNSFYQNDLKEGLITPKTAFNLLCHLWIKFNEPKIGAVQNVTIGGKQTDGSNGENELTYLCMDAAKTVAMPHPNLSLRISAVSKNKIYSKAIKVIKTGIGLPAIFNDEILIPSLMKAGISEKDAHDYCVMGCMEIIIQKKQPSYDDWCLVSLPSSINSVMELSNEIDNFDMFFRQYKIELKKEIDRKIKKTQKNYQALYKIGSDPFASALLDGCLEKGKDMYQSGTPYGAICGIWGLGLATAADALTAIKLLVYDEKKITLKALYDILKQNYKSHEVLRQEIINHVPKYGNDIALVDNVAVDIAKTFCTHILNSNHESIRELYFPLLGSYVYHVNAGMSSATADGRNAREPLSDGISPAQGRDQNGPTAVINSVTKIDHSLIPGGVGMNLKFHPSLFNGENGDRNLQVLIETYFKKKGEQIAINIIGKKTLENAIEQPENYQGLVIRVAGFNEYFTKLDPKVQKEIIERTEHKF